MFGNLLKAVVGAAILPVDVVRDVVTLGGSLTDADEAATTNRLKQIGKNLDKAVGPDGDIS